MKEELFQDYYNQFNVYKLDERGRLFSHDFINKDWINVTKEVPFDAQWLPIKTTDFNNLQLFFYINSSRQFVEDNPEQLMNGIKLPINYGDNLEFFSLDTDVYAKDENDNYFVCLPQLMYPLPVTIDLSNAQKVLPIVLFSTIKEKEEEKSGKDKNMVYFENMDFFLDEEGVVHGFTKDHTKHYRLSLDKGEIWEVENNALDPSWKAISEKEVYDIQDGCYQYGVSEEELKKAKNLEGYIKESEKEAGEKFGSEFRFYLNGFGQVFAKDNISKEYLCDCDGMIRIEELTVQDEVWPELNRTEVIDAIVNFIEYRSEFRKYNKVTIYDLETHLDHHGDLYGRTPDCRYFRLNNYTGEFEEAEEEDWEDDYQYVSIVDNIKRQAKCRLKKIITDWKNKYCKEECTAFTKYYISDNKVYAKDTLNKEWELKLNSITPIDEGSIKEDYSEINEEFLFIALEKISNMTQN